MLRVYDATTDFYMDIDLPVDPRNTYLAVAQYAESFPDPFTGANRVWYVIGMTSYGRMFLHRYRSHVARMGERGPLHLSFTEEQTR